MGRERERERERETERERQRQRQTDRERQKQRKTEMPIDTAVIIHGVGSPLNTVMEPLVYSHFLLLPCVTSVISLWHWPLINGPLTAEYVLTNVGQIVQICGGINFKRDPKGRNMAGSIYIGV